MPQIALTAGRHQAKQSRRALPRLTVENAVVPFAKVSETHMGPLAVGGRTITLVARTRALHVGRGPSRAFAVRVRPSHVEVLDNQGNQHIVRIPDIEGTLIAGIVAAGLFGAAAARLWRRSR